MIELSTIETQDELDSWVRTNIRIVHGNPTMELKVYRKRCEIIQSQLTYRASELSKGHNEMKKLEKEIVSPWVIGKVQEKAAEYKARLNKVLNTMKNLKQLK